MLIDKTAALRCAEVSRLAYNKAAPTNTDDGVTIEAHHFQSITLKHQTVIVEYSDSPDDLYIGFAGTMTDIFSAPSDIFSNLMLSDNKDWAKAVRDMIKTYLSGEDWIQNLNFDLVKYGDSSKAISGVVPDEVKKRLPKSFTENFIVESIQNVLEFLNSTMKFAYPTDDWLVHEGFMGSTIESLFASYPVKEGDWVKPQLQYLFMPFIMIARKSLSKRNIYITGHSQGAAIASLSVPYIKFLSSFHAAEGFWHNAKEISIDIYNFFKNRFDKTVHLESGNELTILPAIQLCTFASPRPANIAYADSVNNMTTTAVAFENFWDAVPHLPFAFNYSSILGFNMKRFFEAVHLWPDPEKTIATFNNNGDVKSEDILEQMNSLTVDLTNRSKLSTTNTITNSIQAFKEQGGILEKVLDTYFEDNKGKLTHDSFVTVFIVVATFYNIDLKFLRGNLFTMFSVILRYRDHFLETGFGKFFQPMFNNLFKKELSAEENDQLNENIKKLWKTDFLASEDGCSINCLKESFISSIKSFEQYSQVGSQMQFFSTPLGHSMVSIYENAINNMDAKDDPTNFF